MTRWEYILVKVVNYKATHLNHHVIVPDRKGNADSNNSPWDVDYFNQLGELGWELISEGSIGNTGTVHTYIFKRPKP